MLLDLAHQIVRDGEGASKFVAVTVDRCGGDDEQRRARSPGLTIADSPLVKTAIAAEDANWGRIVMAVGKAGQAADRDASSRSGSAPSRSRPRARCIPGYSEERATCTSREDEVELRVDVGVRADGARDRVDCDLTHGYIEINAGYERS